jgi:hypothetical protein
VRKLGWDILTALGPPPDLEEESMFPKISMEDPIYVLVYEGGEPYTWEIASEEEVKLSVYADFFQARNDYMAEGKELRALRREELQKLLRGAWDDVTHLVYRPAAKGYLVARETFVKAELD